MRNVFAFAAVVTAIASSLVTASSDVNSTTTRSLAELGYGVLCGLDITGHDVGSVKRTDPATCMQYCLLQGGESYTNAATYTNHDGGTCWCKKVDVNNLQSYLTPKTGAVSYAASQVEKGGAKYIGDKWGLAGWDIVGNDIANVPMPSAKDAMNACTNMCVAYETCFAFTWTEYNGGTCWLKSKVGNVVAKMSTISGFIVRAHPAVCNL